MAIRVMNAVWQSALSGSQKLVALALADWSDDEGGSIRPSVATVARKCSMSASQARRVVHELLEAGVLAIERNPDGGAPGTTRHYRMNVDRLPTPSAGATRTPSVDATPSADATPRMDARDGSHPCAPTTSAHATLSVSRTTKNHHGGRDDGFDMFWDAYPAGPRKVAKSACSKRWKARNLDREATTIVEHVALMARTQQWRDFCPAPLTYLNQRRWEDGAPSTRPAQEPERRVAL
jgi:hypothetical protein